MIRATAEFSSRVRGCVVMTRLFDKMPAMSEGKLITIAAALMFVIGFTQLGCEKTESVGTVQHGSAWLRDAGKSPADAARIAKALEKNSEELRKALAESKTEEFAELRGKVVELDVEVAEQHEKDWLLKTKDGWWVNAPVSDLTPNYDVPKDQIATCKARGIIKKITADKKTIDLGDVELEVAKRS